MWIWPNCWVILWIVGEIWHMLCNNNNTFHRADPNNSLLKHANVVVVAVDDVSLLTFIWNTFTLLMTFCGILKHWTKVKKKFNWSNNMFTRCALKFLTLVWWIDDLLAQTIQILQRTPVHRLTWVGLVLESNWNIYTLID